MGTKSIKKNYLYNLIYQILILILPIITTPYISRMLGAEKIGIYSYTTSIVTYFALFGSLGVSLYGQREIAYANDDNAKRKKIFWEIVILRFITMLISILIFCTTVMRTNSYSLYYKILIIYLMAAAFDISWFFQGMEEFKKTVIRNVIVRIVSISLIFIFIKNPEDLPKYLLIYSLADFVGNLSLWLYLPQYFKGVKVKNINIYKHFFPVLLLFIPQVATRVYSIIDKTMLGWMIVDKAELGNYEQGYKVINVLFTVVTSLSTVMIPRIASVFSSGDKERLKIYMTKSFTFIFLLACPTTLGIIAVSKEFVPIFLGSGYDKAISIVNILALLILLSGITNVIGTQYLLPTKRQKEYTVSIIAGLIINVIFNVIFIKIYKAIGASIATIIAQIVVMAIQVYYVKKEINFIKILKLSYKYFIASIVMFIACFVTNFFIQDTFILIIAKILVGIIIYILMLILFKDNYIYMVKDLFKNLKEKYIN